MCLRKVSFNFSICGDVPAAQGAGPDNKRWSVPERWLPKQALGFLSFPAGFPATGTDMPNTCSPSCYIHFEQVLFKVVNLRSFCPRWLFCLPESAFFLKKAEFAPFRTKVLMSICYIGCALLYTN